MNNNYYQLLMKFKEKRIFLKKKKIINTRTTQCTMSARGTTQNGSEWEANDKIFNFASIFKIRKIFSLSILYTSFYHVSVSISQMHVFLILQ